MGKKKKEKKDKDDLDALAKEYNESLEMLKAKHEQLDGMIREVKIYLNEIKQIRDGIMPKKTLDKI